MTSGHPEPPLEHGEHRHQPHEEAPRGTKAGRDKKEKKDKDRDRRPRAAASSGTAARAPLTPMATIASSSASWQPTTTVDTAGPGETWPPHHASRRPADPRLQGVGAAGDPATGIRQTDTPQHLPAYVPLSATNAPGPGWHPHDAPSPVPPAAPLPLHVPVHGPGDAGGHGLDQRPQHQPAHWQDGDGAWRVEDHGWQGGGAPDARTRPDSATWWPAQSGKGYGPRGPPHPDEYHPPEGDTSPSWQEEGPAYPPPPPSREKRGSS